MAYPKIMQSITGPLSGRFRWFECSVCGEKIVGPELCQSIFFSKEYDTHSEQIPIQEFTIHPRCFAAWQNKYIPEDKEESNGPDSR